MKQFMWCVVLFVSFGSAFSQDTSRARITQQQEAMLKEWPVLWQQKAAEYRALCYQAFNLANLRLEEVMRSKKPGEKLAIITDLDETILDNSYSDAHEILRGKTYTGQSWKEWTARAAATGVPGAVDFLRKAHQKGVTIIYISNRDTSEEARTLVNLQQLKLPDTDPKHMMFQAGDPSKEARRLAVMKRYKVIMLLGDNLDDFTRAFEGKDIDRRFEETDKARADWGRKFIVLPNPTYGEWENAIYNYEKHLTPTEKEEKRRAALTGY